MNKLKLKNGGYYYKLLETKGNRKLYEQYDDDLYIGYGIERLVGYEIRIRDRFYKCTPNLDRAKELFNSKIQ